MNPGIYKLSFEEYSLIPAVNFSTLKEARKSLKHYKHAVEIGFDDSDAFRLGRASHTAVFEQDRFALDYAVFRGERRAGKDWEAFKDAHTGQTILRVDDYLTSIAIRDAVRCHPAAKKYLGSGIAERSIVWRDADTNLLCKGRIDWHNDAHPALVDLKTTRDGDDRLFANSAAQYGYHLQLAFYADGLKSLTGKDCRVVMIVVEKDAPHDVVVYHVDVDVLYRGREEYKELLKRVRGCRDGDIWPGRHTEEQSFELPAWMIEEVDAPEFDAVDADTGENL
jgi:hypothetical protein